jgi:hypothetical protein
MRRVVNPRSNWLYFARPRAFVAGGCASASPRRRSCRELLDCSELPGPTTSPARRQEKQSHTQTQQCLRAFELAGHSRLAIPRQSHLVPIEVALDLLRIRGLHERELESTAPSTDSAPSKPRSPSLSSLTSMFRRMMPPLDAGRPHDHHALRGRSLRRLQRRGRHVAVPTPAITMPLRSVLDGRSDDVGRHVGVGVDDVDAGQ